MARNVFVTGATSGIGLFVLLRLMPSMAIMLISGRRVSYWARYRPRLSKEYGVRVETLVLDVRSREGC